MTLLLHQAEFPLTYAYLPLDGKVEEVEGAVYWLPLLRESKQEQDWGWEEEVSLSKKGEGGGQDCWVGGGGEGEGGEVLGGEGRSVGHNFTFEIFIDTV